jgi:hypothetical protein
MLQELVASLRSVGIGFALADVRQPVVGMMGRSGLLAAMGDDRVYRTVDDAVRSLARG